MKGRVLLGLFIILIGVLFFLGQATDYSFGSLLRDYWPMILIIAGAYSLAVNTAPQAGSILLIIIGAWFQAAFLNWLPDDWGKFIFPVIIIIIGLYVLLVKSGKNIDSRDYVKHFAMFSGIDSKNDSKSFRGGNITAIFGGVELDLRDAVITEKAEMDITTLFGGTDIRVPHNCKVEVTGLPLFGGWSNKTDNKTGGQDLPLLRIRCMAAFGGIDIKD